MGYVDNIGSPVVRHAIGAGDQPLKTRTTFTPDAEAQEAEIARHYALFKGRDSYLGDWHSHPFGTAQLSVLDRRTLRSIARSPEARASNPLMLVVYGDNGWKLTAWLCLPRRIGRITMGFAVAQWPITVLE